MVQHPPNFDATRRVFPSNDYEYGHSTRRQFPNAVGGTTAYGRTYGHQIAFPHSPNQRRLTVNAAVTRRGTELPEHQLRRKTPNGTIDAGYDGSPAHMDPGPPPLKQMIVPATSALPVYTPASFAAFPVHISLDHDGALKHFPGAAMAWSVPETPVPLEAGLSMPSSFYFGAGSQYLQSPLQEMPGLFRTAYQPYIKHGALHGAAFGSPPIVELRDGVRGHVVDGYSDACMYPFQSTNMASGLYAQSQPFPGMAAPGPTMTPRPVGYLGAAALHTPSGHLGGASTFPTAGVQPINLNLDALSLGPGVHGSGKTTKTETPNLARFREKVLAQAHQAYVELLAYHHHSRKAQASKGACGGVGQSSKLAVYPKPPRPFLGTTTSSAAKGLRTALGPEPSRGAVNRDGRGWTSVPSNDEGSRHGQAPPGWPNFVQQPASTGAMANLSRGSRPVAYSSLDMEKKSPAAAAQATLEVLCHLCERSGWKWVDGVLLGGCLHYGLEHYEKALEWFSRIIELDSG